MFLSRNLNVKLALLIVLLDLLSKRLATVFLMEPATLVPGFLRLALSENTGIAFGIPIPNAAMLAIAPAILILIIWLLPRAFDVTKSPAKIGLGLILGGGTGNFINRLWMGSVTDFISFSFWPSFNIADSAITVGFFLFVIFYGKIIRVKNRRKT